MTYKNIQATIELLAEAYPRCFHIYAQRRRPLKVGIHHDIPKYLHFTIDSKKPKALSAALRCYCMNPRYLAVTVEGAVRVDLNGEPCGTVSAQEAAGARERLEKLQEKYKRRQVAKEQAERKQKNKGRLTLDDLRKAAQARRAA